MKIDIFRKGELKDTLIYSFLQSDQDVLNEELGKSKVYKAYFEQPRSKSVSLKKGDFIVYNGVRLSLNQNAYPTENLDTGGYVYSGIEFHSFEERLKDFTFVYTTNNFLTEEVKFGSISTGEEFLGLIASNLKYYGFGEFSVGVAPQDYKEVVFDGVSIFEGLNRIADAYELSWWFEGNKVNLGEKVFGTIAQLVQGVDVGEISFERPSGNLVTRLRAFGSSRNLGFDYRRVDAGSVLSSGDIRLRLPNNIKWVDIFPGLPEEEQVQGVVIFDDVYPRKVNSVTDVTPTTVIAEGESIPSYAIKDSSFEFQSSYILPGKPLKIIFESGVLNGREFGVQFNEEEQTYTIIPDSVNGGVYIPNSNYGPSVGDNFVVFNYDADAFADLGLVDAAEQELLDKLNNYVADYNKGFILKATTRAVVSKQKELDFEIGQRVEVIHTMLGSFSASILGYSKRANNPYEAIYTIGTTSAYSKFAELQNQIISGTENMASAIGDSVLKIYSVGSKYFLSRLYPDTAQQRIKFLAGLEAGEFSSGMFTGKGGRIDDKGNAELESLVIRSLLEVPEIRYNRLTLVGEEIAIGAGGVILDVTQPLDPAFEEPVVLDHDLYEITLKLEEGEMNPFHPFDIVKGIYNQGVGFRTSWFRVESVDMATMRVVMGADEAVPSGQNFPPKPFMNIAKVGNFVDTERQSSIFLSAKEGNIIMLDGVSNYMAGVKSFQLGKPKGLENIIDFTKLTQIDQNSSYLYARGIMAENIIKVDVLGVPIKEIRDRGVWSLETAEGDDPYRYTETLQDAAWMPNGKYICIVDKTLEMPEIGSTDWVRVVEIKDEEYSSKSTTFFAKPLRYRRGDTWFLLEDMLINNIMYRKGTMLHAAYATGMESDWRQVIYEPEATGGINILRNYDLRYPDFLYWGGVGETIDVPVSELPTEFYKTGFNIIADEWGFNYPVIDEDGNEIEL